MMRQIVFIVKWIVIFILFVIALNLRNPYLLKIRDTEFIGSLTICIMMGGATMYQLWKRWNQHLRKIEKILFLVLLSGVMMMILGKEAIFRFKKYTVLHADLSQLQRLGRHFLVGYTYVEDIVPLVAKGAIGGLFLTRRNVQNLSAEQIHQTIALFQQLRAAAHLPPLLIATDQEGGIVSRLSPPLPYLPALSSVVDRYASSPAAIAAMVEEYGEIQGKDLKDLGINVNFSPVVDLKLQTEPNPLDFHSYIRQRAISADAAVVTQVALTYSQSLEHFGVIPTVKHFPGLGRVAQDTHHFQAELDMGIQELQDRDWLPFRDVITRTHAFMMLGHVKLLAVDPKNPVSYSSKVVQGIIRDQWQHNGVLITDDFTMDPIYYSKQGIGQATVTALNAGVDLVLIAYDGDQYYEAMYAVIQADKNQQVNNSTLRKSEQRLERVIQEVVCKPINNLTCQTIP
jgi:beta-N-acetylhexosaminidase